MNTFSENNKVTRVSNAVAAGTTDIEATGVDMSGFNSVSFLFLFGTITADAVTSVKAQQSDDNGSTDGWSDIEGSAIDVADDTDNKVALLEITRPVKRYVRPVIDRGTQNAVVDGILAIQSHPRSLPITEDSTILDSLLLNAPAEGTA